MHLFEKKIIEQSCHDINRRGFLTLGLLTVSACLVPAPAQSALKNFFIQKKTLSFYNTHTEEHLETVYWNRGMYIPDAMDRINTILRDHYTGDISPIDPDLLDLLFALRAKVKTREPFHIISGYRSPQTNEFLWRQGHGVAKNSMHLYGKAADIRLPGYELSNLRQVAVSLRSGGVGYYPGSDFIHVDTGRIRCW